MEEHYDEYITHLFEKSRDIIKRDSSVCFYDCLKLEKWISS